MHAARPASLRIWLVTESGNSSQTSTSNRKAGSIPVLSGNTARPSPPVVATPTAPDSAALTESETVSQTISRPLVATVRVLPGELLFCGRNNVPDWLTQHAEWFTARRVVMRGRKSQARQYLCDNREWLLRPTANLTVSRARHGYREPIFVIHSMGVNGHVSSRTPQASRLNSRSHC